MYGERRTRQKDRYVAGVVTPAAPFYLHGALVAARETCLDAVPPVLGICWGPGGYQVCCLISLPYV